MFLTFSLDTNLEDFSTIREIIVMGVYKIESYLKNTKSWESDTYSLVIYAMYPA